MNISRFKSIISSGLILCLSIVAGCRHTVINDSETEAIVTLDQYRRAYSIIQKVDYIPFVVTRDGCYARALYMAMELAAEQIQSSSTFVLAAQGTLLHLNDGTVWLYHVAPMLQVPGYAAAIMDPSMAQQPMAQSEWLAAMHGQGATVYSIPGPYYGYWYGSQPFQSNVISSFAEMPSFRVEDIQHACQTANMLIGEENNLTADQKATKREKLADRTVYLGQMMVKVGKLTNTRGIQHYNCQLLPSY